MLASMFVRQQASPTVKSQNHDDLVALKALVEAGKVTTRHRPDVPVDPDPRGDRSRRRGTRPGHGGHQRLTQILSAIVSSPFVSQRLVPVYGRRSKDDLDVLKGLIEAGKVTPVIDRTYPLCEVPEAIRYLETRHTRGKLVITV